MIAPFAASADRLVSLFDCAADDVAGFGGKAAGLRAAFAAGLRVPPTAIWRGDVGGVDLSALRVELAAKLGPPPYFVRSSFAEEDAEGRSFAGQGLSRGHLWAHEVPAAVAEVRASWQSPAAASYRRRMGMREEAGGAVIVQREVIPIWSGVLFTRAPGAIGDWARVEAVRGYGEAVVSGRVAPTVVEFAHDANRTLDPLPPGLGSALRLWRSAIRRLEAVVGGPADAEWVLDARGKLWFVQVRPARSETPLLWSSALGAEFWSGDVSRLMFETVGRTIEATMLDQPLAVLGGVRGPHLRRASRRIWVGIEGLRRAVAVVPSWAVTPTVLRMLPPPLRARWQRERAAWSPIIPRGLLAAVPRFLAARFPWLPLLQFAALPFLRRRADAWRDRDVPTDRAALVAEIQALLVDLAGNLRWVTWGMLYAYVLTPLLDRVLGSLTMDPEASCLYTGLPFDPVRELDDDLRSLVRRFPALVDDAEAVGEAPRAALRALQLKWGHRSEERDLRGRRWAEAPELITSLLPLAAAEAPHRGRHWLAWLTAQGFRMPLSLPRLAAASLLAAIVRPYLGFRERMRDLADRYLLALRRRFLALAALDGIDDPWAAGWDGGGFVSDDDPDTLHLADPPPAFLIGDLPLADEVREDANGLRGLGVSPGIGEGKVVWIERPEDVARFQPGDVLCADYLDPSLSLVLEHASAAAFVHGGALSHGAIVAREYGVPAVVAVTELRIAAPEGTRLRVDGLSGRLEPLA